MKTLLLSTVLLLTATVAQAQPLYTQYDIDHQQCAKNETKAYYDDCMKIRISWQCTGAGTGNYDACMRQYGLPSEARQPLILPPGSRFTPTIEFGAPAVPVIVYGTN